MGGAEGGGRGEVEISAKGGNVDRFVKYNGDKYFSTPSLLATPWGSVE